MQTQNDPRTTKRIQLKVPEDLHLRLRVEAAKRRTTLQDLLITWTAEKLAEAEGPDAEAAPRITPEERQARVDAAVGSMRHVPVSVESFLREKQEDIECEEERWARLRGERAR